MSEKILTEAVRIAVRRYVEAAIRLKDVFHANPPAPFPRMPKMPALERFRVELIHPLWSPEKGTRDKYVRIRAGGVVYLWGDNRWEWDHGLDQTAKWVIRESRCRARDVLAFIKAIERATAWCDRAARGIERFRQEIWRQQSLRLKKLEAYLAVEKLAGLS